MAVWLKQFLLIALSEVARSRQMSGDVPFPAGLGSRDGSTGPVPHSSWRADGLVICRAAAYHGCKWHGVISVEAEASAWRCDRGQNQHEHLPGHWQLARERVA